MTQWRGVAIARPPWTRLQPGCGEDLGSGRRMSHATESSTALGMWSRSATTAGSRVEPVVDLEEIDVGCCRGGCRTAPARRTWRFGGGTTAPRPASIGSRTWNANGMARSQQWVVENLWKSRAPRSRHGCPRKRLGIRACIRRAKKSRALVSEAARITASSMPARCERAARDAHAASFEA
jgi:hypothetical protein